MIVSGDQIEVRATNQIRLEKGIWIKRIWFKGILTAAITESLQMVPLPRIYLIDATQTKIFMQGLIWIYGTPTLGLRQKLQTMKTLSCKELHKIVLLRYPKNLTNTQMQKCMNEQLDDCTTTLCRRHSC